MASITSLLVGLMAVPAISVASVAPAARDTAAGTSSNPGFLSFPIKRGDKSTRTLSSRQASASLVNEQDTSYLIELAFGSNAQTVKVAIDTGSDELFVDPNCNDTDFSNSEQQECVAEGVYDPTTSTSSKATGESSQIVYGSGAVNIDYYIDSIGIPGASKNLTEVQFGKATASQDLSEGILGLGFGQNVNLNYSNFIDVLQSQGLTNTKAFSVALGTSDTQGGNIVFGGVDTKKFSGSLASLDISGPVSGDIQRYAVSLSSISYTPSGGSAKKYDNSALSGVVLDTGSSLCELPADIVSDMASDLGAQQDSSGLLTVDCNKASSSNKLAFEFDGGATVNVPLDQFVIQSGNTCVLGVEALQEGSGITALLGDTFLRNAYVVFDQTNMKINIAQYVNCGTNEQAIQTGSSGASGFKGECDGSSITTGSSNNGSESVAKRPGTAAVLALVAGIAALVNLC